MSDFDFTIVDVAKLVGIYLPNNGRASVDVSCPFCGDGNKRQKHMNINIKKNVFRCNYCNVHGGMLDLYGKYFDMDTKSAYKEIMDKLGKSNVKYLSKPRDILIQEKNYVDQYLPASVERRNQAYTILLSELSLTDRHRENLRNRGLSDAQIELDGYRSIPVIGFEEIAYGLIEKGIDLHGIPGFFIARRNLKDVWVINDFRLGIMIPVRNIDGLIEGFQIRLDNTKKRKFRWMSTNEMNGGSHVFSWCHVVGPVKEKMYLTEGPMKANIIYHLGGKSTIAIPGVNCAEQFAATLDSLKEHGTKIIVSAFDMDKRENEQVKAAEIVMRKLILAHGMKYKHAEWNPECKGLDDYLYAKEQARKNTCA